MRLTLSLLTIAALTAPALAQFPPPGIYSCVEANGDKVGALSLLVAGDYQWQPVGGNMENGQVASASNSVEALSGPLADQHWKGTFSSEAGATTFVFATDAGQVVCR